MTWWAVIQANEYGVIAHTPGHIDFDRRNITTYTLEYILRQWKSSSAYTSDDWHCAHVPNGKMCGPAVNVSNNAICSVASYQQWVITVTLTAAFLVRLLQ